MLTDDIINPIAMIRTSMSSDKENDNVVVTQDMKLSETDDENYQTGCSMDSINT